MAARKLAGEGLTLDITTLEMLAQKFQALNDPAEKQKFLLDNLGRAGFEYATVLGMSKDELGRALRINAAIFGINATTARCNAQI